MFVTEEAIADATAGPGSLGDPSDPEQPGLEELPVERLEDEIAELAAHIYAGTCRWLELVAEFDRRGGWGPSGCRSCAEWISWRCAVGSRAAREHVRVARCLGDLPRIHDSFARGELSYAKVRALTRVADPDSEAELLELARLATAAQLERIVRAYRRVTTQDANEVHADCYLAWSWEEDGSLAIHGRLAPEDGALLLRALEASRDRLWRERDAEEGGSAEPHAATAELAELAGGSAEPIQRPGLQPTNADALVDIAEASLADDSTERSGGDRHQVVVRVDAATLTNDERDRHGRCDLDDGVAIAPETARRVACDSSLVSILESEGATLSVGRKRRTIPPALRRALRARDGTCRFPGCENSRFTDAHHLHHWASGGETRLDNLLLLCRRHHRLVHEAGFSVERLGDDDVRFRRPDGRRIEPVPGVPRGDPAALVGRNRGAGAAIDADTSSNGTGERMNLGMAVDRVLAAVTDSPAPP